MNLIDFFSDEWCSKIKIKMSEINLLQCDYVMCYKMPVKLPDCHKQVLLY